MGESETLLALRLTSPVLLAWPVMLYVLLVSLFMLMRRTELCLLTTFLLTFYWGFSLHWGTFLSSSTYMIAFALYTICGLLIAILTIGVLLSKPASSVDQRNIELPQ